MRQWNATLIQDVQGFIEPLRDAIFPLLLKLGKANHFDEYVRWKVGDYLENVYLLPVENHLRYCNAAVDLANLDNQHPELVKYFYAVVRGPMLDWDTTVRIEILGRDLYVHYYREKRL